jgi:hypothetical protein
MVAVYDIAELKQRVASREWQLSSIEMEERGCNAQLLEMLEAVERTLVQNQRHIHFLKKKTGLALEEFKRLRDLLPEMRIDRPNLLWRIFHPRSLAARHELVERLETITSATNAESGGGSECGSAEQADPAGLHKNAGNVFLVVAIVSLMMVAALLANNLYGDSIDEVMDGTLLHGYFGDVLIDDGDHGAISQRLELGRKQIAHLRLTNPAGDNAYETYQKILSVQPNNADALEGIKQIGAKYIELASRAAAGGDLNKSGHYAELASKLAPEHIPEAIMAVPAEATPEAHRKASPPTATSNDNMANPHDSIGMVGLAATSQALMATAHSAAPNSSTERPREMTSESIPGQDKPHNQDLNSGSFDIRPPSDLTYPWEPPFQTPVHRDFRRSHDHDSPVRQAEGVGGQGLASNGQGFGHANGSSAGSGSGSGGNSPGDKGTGDGEGKGKGEGKGGSKGGGKGNGNGKGKGKGKG